jgi:hypothetical protein
MISSLGDAWRWYENNSFYNNVLRHCKAVGADLVEEVNQVRKYRNWVAHGRRGEQPDAVDPATARDRLQRFLDFLLASANGHE